LAEGKIERKSPKACSLSWLVKVSETRQVVYKAEKRVCRTFPEPDRDGLVSGAKRNFWILRILAFGFSEQK